jgi:molybdopterin-guanine dinucleotide biosynthesis protein A
MGRDKALLCVSGIPMALRVGTAMRVAGATEVFAIGGDAVGLESLGLSAVADTARGEGPLGGITTALAVATEDVVVVTACDMPWLEPVQVRMVVDALGNADVAVSAADGQLQPLHAAWQRSVLPVLERAFVGGERSPMRMIARLHHAVVELGPGAWSTDFDWPIDLVRGE